MAMSASLSCIAWCSAMGLELPKDSRCCAYRIAALKAACATPTARAATLMRPVSRPLITWPKPTPSCSPIRLSAGMA